MAHSSISFHDRERLMSDAEAIVVARLTADLATQKHWRSLETPNVSRLLDWWRRMFGSFAIGAVDLKFDEHIRNDEDRRAILEILNRSKESIAHHGDFVPKELLNKVGDAP